MEIATIRIYKVSELDETKPWKAYIEFNIPPAQPFNRHQTAGGIAAAGETPEEATKRAFETPQWHAYIAGK